MSPIDAALIFSLAFGASVVQAATGLGFGLLIVPPLVLVIGVKDAVVVSNILSTSLSSVLLTRVHAQVAWRTALLLSLAALAGMPLGLALLVVANPSVLQAVIALAVIAFTILLARGVALPVHGLKGEAVAGAVSGVLRTSTSMGGPPVIILLQGRGLESAAFRATMTAFFVIGGVISVGLFAAAGRVSQDILLESAVAVPALLAGVVAGSAVYRRANEQHFRRAVLGVLFISALVALAGAIAG